MRFYQFNESINDIADTVSLIAMNLLGQAKDDEPIEMQTDAFIEMVRNTDSSFDYDTLKALVDTNPKVKNLITDFSQDKITFGQAEDDTTDFDPADLKGSETTDQVDAMAKRALKKRSR
jgi:hypothetical protein